MSCDLCNLKKLSKWYYSNEKLVVCECIKCKMPMVVLRRHTMEPTEEELSQMRGICYRLFGKEVKDFRTEQRTIPDHLHWHILLQETIP